MSQLITCPECKKHLQVPEELLGKKVQCPECKHTFTATGPEEIQINTGTTVSAPAPSKTPEWDKKTSSVTGKSRENDDDEEERTPRKRRRDRDDDEDDDDDRPRRRRRRSAMGGGNYMPHRGGMILAFGLISIITGIFIFGIIAWIMGNNDLAEIRAGRMDPEGEGMTQAGKIIGMISTIMTFSGVLLCCGFYGCIFLLAGFGAAAGGGPGPRPPRRNF